MPCVGHLPSLHIKSIPSLLMASVVSAAIGTNKYDWVIIIIIIKVTKNNVDNDTKVLVTSRISMHASAMFTNTDSLQ